MENIFSSFSLDCKQEIIYRFSQAQKRSSLFFSHTTCPGRVVRLGAQCTDHWTTEQSRGVDVPAVQLTTHVKISTFYGRTVVRLYGRTVVRSYGRTVVRSYGRTSKFFRLDGLLLFLYNYRATLCELHYKW